MGDATVWARALDARWERVGADRVRGVWPEGLRASANDWGPDTCSFLIRRDPGAVFPEVLPFTPIDVEVAGERDWSGFVWDPPQQAGERAIAVECRGWQYHADDELLDRLYVHDRLAEWGDAKAQPDADIVTYWEPGGQVAQAPGGGTLIGMTTGETWQSGKAVGIALDLGPVGPYPKKIRITARRGDNPGTDVYFSCQNNDRGIGVTPPGGGEGVTLQAGTTTMPETDTVYDVDFTVGRRFVAVYVFNNGGADVVLGEDHVVFIRSIKLFGDAAYESGDESVLKASQVVTDLLPFCPALDQRTDLIQPSGVVLPEFAFVDQTPRQGMEQANAADGYQLRVTPETLLEYRPRPTVPILRTGSWAADGLSGVSRGSAEPMGNRVIAKGTDGTGRDLAVSRHAAEQPGAQFEDVATPGFSNPSFDANATGWAANGSTIARSTAQFHSTPASGLWDSVEAPDWVENQAPFGTFRRGVLYRALLWLRAAGTGFNVRMYFGIDPFHESDVGIGEVVALPDAVWTPVSVVWMPREDYTTGPVVRLDAHPRAFGGTATGAWVDDLGVQVARPTIIDRRGYTRTRGIRVARTVSEATLADIADVAVREAARTPFKGSQTVERGDVRTFVGDAPVHPAHLLRQTGELLHVSHLVDPDTGNLGRDARVVTVAYDDDAASSQVALDATRTNFETQLARYEVTGRR